MVATSSVTDSVKLTGSIEQLPYLSWDLPQSPFFLETLLNAGSLSCGRGIDQNSIPSSGICCLQLQKEFLHAVLPISLWGISIMCSLSKILETRVFRFQVLLDLGVFVQT